MAKLQSVNSTTSKETLYVDVDDEITAIIDKVAGAKSKVVALVLPKRCPVLQSVVNMKLLKRTADKVGKNLVLVTSESGLMPLAGAVGLYVASTPSSKPAIPETPSQLDDDETDTLDEPLKVVDGNEPEGDFDAKSSSSKSIGELAAAGAAAKDSDDDIDESIDMDDAGAEAPVVDEGKKPKKAPKIKKDKKLVVPNFDSFRKRLMLIPLILVLLAVLWYVAFKVLPSAAVTIGTDSNTIPTNATLNLDTTAKQLDASSDTIPATAQQQQKTSTQTVPATGQQNNGTKAQGTVDLQQQVCAPNLGQTPAAIPAGSSVTSGGNTYITQQDAGYSAHGFSGGSCAVYDSGSVPITALKGGTNFNTSSSASFTGPGGAKGTGSASGGTDNIITVVQQSDITNATNKINSSDSGSVKQQLESNLESAGLQPVPATFLAGTPQVTMNEQVGAQASSVTVTAVTNYTMLGVKKSDLQTLVDNNVSGQLDKGKQVILDDGVANAQFSENNPGSATAATVAMSVNSQVGPQINAADLKKKLAGMKSGDVDSYLKQTPGVTNTNVHYSPFWVNTVPSNPSKVTVNIVKAKS